MDNKRIHTLLTDFIPIFLIFSFATLPKETILFSKTVLGKLIAVCLILYYTQQKFVYGLFVCAVILFYYQSEIVENTLNDTWRHSFSSLDVVPWNSDIEMYAGMDAGKTADPKPNEMASDIAPETFSGILSAEKAFAGLLPFDATSVEAFSYTPFISFNSQNEDILRGADKKEKLKAAFRKQVCVNGKPHFKGQPVRPEMADHVFREIEMGDKKCNPCDTGCDFNIIEERLASEEQLVRPKSSKEASSIDWKWERMQTAIYGVASLPHLFAEYWGEW